MRASVETAIFYLKQGQPVALPTETVYGLAAPLSNPDAIEKVFQLKGRPKNNPLIVHLSSIEQLSAYVDTLPENIQLLAQAFWPGPLTLVLPVNAGTIPSNVTCGLSTAAFRIPNHPQTLAIIDQVGPLVMPSANLSGRPSATQAAHVEADFGEDFPVVDGGSCTHGLESTILISLEGQWKVLRQGAIPASNLEFVLEEPVHIDESTDEEQPLCPGRLYRHYAPKAKLLLSKDCVQAEAILGFSDRNYPEEYPFFNLGRSSHPEEAANRLYACLRALDDRQIKSAWVDTNFPRTKLWSTIYERLHRASL
ncbi:MAG: L-threonylcarbamoyladenylate synthase [Parachlamydiales bacterium]|jgi:L-threonylcarbamoyladenylate synthase